MKSFLITFLIIPILISSSHADIINVPADISSIQGGIDMAFDGDTVLIAEGIYYENINFKGKAITVASNFWLDDDTSHISKTIINGSQPSNPDSGSVVLFISGEDTTSVLCGFTITGGTGTIVFEPPLYDFRGGGGIYCRNSSGRFVSNKVINNTLSDYSEVVGGGLLAAEPGYDYWTILENNQIKNNTIDGVNGAYGGGVFLGGNGKLLNNIISNNSCTATEFEANGGGIKIVSTQSRPKTVLVKGNYITHNLAKGEKVLPHDGAKGGGIVNHFSKVIILNNNILYNKLNAFRNGDAFGAGIAMFLPGSGCIISRNNISNNTINETITSGGGGIYLRHNEVPIQIINNIISKNSALNGGGLYLSDSNSEIINNTIVYNTVSSNGGGLYSTLSIPVVVNTILWYNEAKIGSQIFGSSAVLYSNIQDGWEGEGNINRDPGFLDSLFNLSDTSWCVGNGVTSIQINDVLYNSPSYDYFGNPRPYPVDLAVDMGAVESIYDRVPVSIEKIRNEITPLKFALYQNYPNPFNPVTTIRYDVKTFHGTSPQINLSIYNLLGQKVATLVDKKQPAGSYQVEWDAAGFSSGIYYYHLKAGEFNETKKLILMK